MLSVDPGVKYYAWVLWEAGQIYTCGVCSVGVRIDHSELVIEGQEIRGKNQKARPNDIVKLAFSAGRIADRYQHVTVYHYYEWAGQTPEKILRARIEAALYPEELAPIARHSKKDQGHIFEAAGIGLFHLRKLGIRRKEG